MNLESCKIAEGVYEVDVDIVAVPHSIFVSMFPKQFDFPRGESIHHSPDKSTSTKVLASVMAKEFTDALKTNFNAAVISDDGVPLVNSFDVPLPAGRSYHVQLKAGPYVA